MNGAVALLVNDGDAATYVLIHGAGDSAFYWHLLAPELAPVGLMVLVAGMVPSPGERGEDWSANTGFEQAADEQEHDARRDRAFYQDVPRELAAEALSRGRDQAEASGLEPWTLDAWPDVPTRYLLCRDDRFFPAGWMRAVVRDRLGITADEIDGGHCPA